MGVILDSSILIASERMGENARGAVASLLQTIGAQEGVAISTVTVMEFAHGIERADTSERRGRRQSYLDQLLAGMPVHPVSVAIALRAGRIDGMLQAQGSRIALADLLIGATALELGYSVATHNLRHFRRIPGLSVQSI